MLHFVQHDKTSRAQHPFSHSAHSVSSFRALFFVIPSILFLSFRASARNPAHGCFTSFSMTRPAVPSTLFSFRALCFVIPSSLFCHSEHTFSVIPSVSEESSAWMLRLAQHDKTSRAQHSFFHSAHSVSSFRALFSVIPCNPFRALCFVIPSSLFCHSEHTFSVIPSVSEESSAWMLRLAQHDKTSRAQHSFFHSAHSVSSFRALFFVIPSILFLSFRTQ
jgi:hypothetical protein